MSEWGERSLRIYWPNRHDGKEVRQKAGFCVDCDAINLKRIIGGDVGFDSMCLFGFGHTVCEGTLRPKQKCTIGCINLGLYKSILVSIQWREPSGLLIVVAMNLADTVKNRCREENNVGYTGIWGQLEERGPERRNKENQENTGPWKKPKEKKVSHQLGCFWRKMTQNLNWFKFSRFIGPYNWKYKPQEDHP